MSSGNVVRRATSQSRPLPVTPWCVGRGEVTSQYTRNAIPERHRRVAVVWHPMTAREITDVLLTDTTPKATRKQAIGVQGYIFHAMRRRGGTVEAIDLFLKFADSRLRNLRSLSVFLRGLAISAKSQWRQSCSVLF
jgi:hypothetical protein